MTPDPLHGTSIQSSERSHAPGSPSRAGLAGYCVLVFLLAFGLRLHGIFASSARFHVPLATEPQAIADSLVADGAFANPFRYRTGPTAHEAPLYPLLLAGIMYAFPDDASYETAKQVLAAGAASLQFALLPVLAALLGFPRRAGIAAALICVAAVALAPPETFETSVFEHSYTALALVGLAILTASALRNARFDAVTSAAWGLGWGTALLLTPSVVLLYPAWLVLACTAARRAGNSPEELREAPLPRPARQPLAFAAIATAVVLAVLAPWMIRNVRALGAPVWGRSNLGLELRVSNNDCAAATFDEMRNSGCHALLHPNANPAEARRIRDLGEVAYNREQMRAALAWVRGNPGRFARLTVARFARFWFPPLGAPAATCAVALLTILGFLGLAVLIRSNTPAAILAGSVLLVYPLPYYVVQHMARYRYPIFWTSGLLAGYALTRLFQRAGGKGSVDADVRPASSGARS